MIKKNLKREQNGKQKVYTRIARSLPLGYKDSTVQLALNSEEKTSIIAKDLNLNLKTLYLWINTYKKANNIPTRTRKEFWSGKHSNTKRNG